MRSGEILVMQTYKWPDDSWPWIFMYRPILGVFIRIAARTRMQL